MTIGIFEKTRSACIVSHRMYREHLSRLGFDLLGVSAVRYIAPDGEFKEETFMYSYEALDNLCKGDSDAVQQLAEGDAPALAHIDCVIAVSFVIRLASGQYVHTGMIDLYKVFPAAGMAFVTTPANMFREATIKMIALAKEKNKSLDLHN